jgi:tetratricopeptide (TPR) repeat protein
MKIAEAIELTRELVRLDPLDENAHALMYLHMGVSLHFREAREALAEGRAKIPESVLLLNLETFSHHLISGDYRKAIEAKYKTLAIEPLNTESRRDLAMMYLAIGMPDEAEAWFDRAAAIAPETERDQYRLMHQTVMDVYHQRNDEAIFISLKQWLTEFPHRIWEWAVPPYLLFLEYGERLGKLDEVLAWFKAAAPHLFEEPPTGLEKNEVITFLTGLALLLEGDQQRGEAFVRFKLEIRRRQEQAGYATSPETVVIYLALGETDKALEKVRAIAERNKYYGLNDGVRQMMVRYSRLFEPLRKEPEFMALLEEYDRNAAEQRRQLKEIAGQLPLK